MTWKLQGKNGFPERARLLIEFSSPLPEKTLRKCASELERDYASFGFDSVERVPSSIQGIVIQGPIAGLQPEQPKNGFVFRQAVDENLTEELGLRDNVFGYFAYNCEGIETFTSRLERLLPHALSIAIDAVDIQSVKLEAWNHFLFEGPSERMGLTHLLKTFDSIVPQGLLHGEEQWHSHAGWFEFDGPDGRKLLINRNIDVTDVENTEGSQRHCLIHILVGHQVDQAQEINSEISSLVGDLYARSIEIFSDTIYEREVQ